MPVNQHILREELMRYLPVEQRACADPVAIPSAPLMGTLELPSEECDPPRARASRRCQIPPRHRFSPSPTARPPSVKPITNPGPLQFLGNLGSGSYGSAVCVRDLSSGATVCLKIVIKPPAQDEARKEQLKAERRAYEAIAKSDTQCKFLMVCHGIFMAGEYVYFAMDYIQRNLHSLLSEKIEPDQMRKWVAQMALGIDALHKMKIIHRDIKPENVLVDNADNIRIIDFGTAYIMHGEKRPEKFVGTKAYRAPECSGEELYGPEVDYWALGCTVWDMHYGESLFENQKKLEQYLNWDPEANRSYFRSRKKKLSDAEDELLSGLLHKNREERWNLDNLRELNYFENEGRNVVEEMEALTAAPSDSLGEDPPKPTEEWQMDLNSGDSHFEWYNSKGIWSEYRDQPRR